MIKKIFFLISLGEDVEIEMKPLKGKEKAGADGMATFLVVAEEINGKVDFNFNTPLRSQNQQIPDGLSIQIRQ